MAFRVFLDTCVLHPAHLRDTLLRLAARGLFEPLWSPDMQHELGRSLHKRGIDSASAKRPLEQMQLAYPHAMVEGYEALIPVLRCDPKDRHVLAAAIRGQAAVLLTYNLRDFPLVSVEPYDVEVMHPDEFLIDLLDLAAVSVIDELRGQAASNRRHPRTLEQLLEVLEKSDVKGFVAEVRQVVSRDPEVPENWG